MMAIKKRPREGERKEEDIEWKIIRAPVMPMLKTPETVPLLFKPFVCPVLGWEPPKKIIKFLGTRRRTGPLIFKRPEPLPVPDPEVAPPITEEKKAKGDPLILFKSADHEVVCDPHIGDKLREHQRVGVSFLYECVSGMKKDLYNGRGCILADDMGLGKTLQSIAVLWVALTTNIKPGKEVMCRRALIITPASLVGNWAAELDKCGLELEDVNILVSINQIPHVLILHNFVIIEQNVY